jgi:hypothetical protein
LVDGQEPPVAEEIRNPMATQIDAAIKQALVYEPVRS